MNYVLSKEQRDEIMKEYCDDATAITIIEDRLNEFNLKIDEEDFYEIVCNVACQYESIKAIIRVRLSKKQPPIDMTKINIHDFVENYHSVDQMILYELKNKYCDTLKYVLSDDSRTKIKSLQYNKKRHF